MKTEISAGGIVVRKYRGSWRVLLLKDMNSVWTFPKGLIEKDEELIAAAQREISEEVGLNKVKFLTEIDKIHYFYQRDGLISKNVHYYLFLTESRETLKPQKEEGISEAKWFSFEEAAKIIGYPKTNLALLEKSKQYLSNSLESIQVS